MGFVVVFIYKSVKSASVNPEMCNIKVYFLFYFSAVRKVIDILPAVQDSGLQGPFSPAEPD